MTLFNDLSTTQEALNNKIATNLCIAKPDRGKMEITDGTSDLKDKEMRELLVGLVFEPEKHLRLEK